MLTKEIDNSNNLELTLLLKDYDNRYTEMKLHMKRYHSQSNYMYIFFSLFISTLSFLLSKIYTTTDAATKTDIKLPVELLNFNPIFLFVILLLCLFLMYYMYVLLQDALCMMYINMYRIGSLENKINEIAGKHILTWDSEILISYHKPTPVFHKFWVKPSYSLPVWGLLVMTVLNILLCLICYSFLRSYFTLFSIISGILFIFNLVQSIKINTVGRPLMQRTVNEYGKFQPV
jgi:hypothetical protein